MSACSNTIRALSRSRVPANKTLLPFLYQTPTIQQWKPVAQHFTRRNISRYRREDESSAADIPFENEASLPPALEDTEGPLKTTMTASERAAFEKLYRRFNTRGSRQEEKDHEVEIDAIADEYWEPDEEDQPSASLDKIFDEALRKGSAVARERGRSSSEQPRAKKPKEDLKTMAEHVLKGTRPLELQTRVTRAQRKAEMSAQTIQLKKLRLIERGRVDELLTSARTDRELWEVLHREVFAQIRQLDLDGIAPKPKKENRTKNPKTTPDPRVLFPNYPHHILTAIITLRNHFPASPLPLSILPTIKSFGRSSYALGASTALYNQLLGIAWLQQSSYTQLVSLLTDMHNGAIEFNAETLTLLDQILKEHTLARSGKLGKGMQMVYGLDQFSQGVQELINWRAVIAERVGIEVGRREKGTVPMPRRRRAVDDQSSQHAPLSEGADATAEQFFALPQTKQISQSGPQPAKSHDVDLGDGFEFLSEGDIVADPNVQHQAKNSPVRASETADEDVPRGSEQALLDDDNDYIKEEADKNAHKTEATAKTSTGGAPPWTPS
ncbi:hypothetical protein E8E13_001025 [Curvularia kusanoi]|uniref:Mtf2-like C-terminal domain-containing protein n=1 Tax=Curvularia kusanoi TaxID=90978 RepID=A0A9P4WB84_CURKU|nr:hypothetical protein E8E13_001025 [Curvularia kusanoi]